MANGGLTSIGICADTHYWPDGRDFVTSDGSLQLQGSSKALLAALFDELSRANLDLVLHLGDLTCGGGTYAMSPDVFETAVVDLYQTYQGLKTPVFALPGNHDSMPGAGGWQVFHSVWGTPPGIGMTLDLSKARLVLLNTHGHSPAQIAGAEDHDPVYGWVNDDELARLEESLRTADKRPVLLFTHQLLAPWSSGNGWRDFYGVQNTAAVFELLARYGNVRTVFQAHAHRFDIQQRMVGDRACTFVILPSLIEYPLAWMRLDLSPAAVRLRLNRLPLPDLQEASRLSGTGQSWRAGRPEWWDLTIPLQESHT
jgi:3',5'-cyclic AMP phosphodiesterase CpdA